MSTCFREHRPLLVDPLPALPPAYWIHRRSDEPPALDLPVIPGVGQQVLDPLLGSTSGPVPRVVGRRPCHSHPSQREGLGRGPVGVGASLRPHAVCREHTLRLLHAATGCPQPSAMQRRTLSMHVEQYPVLLSLTTGPLHDRHVTSLLTRPAASAIALWRLQWPRLAQTATRPSQPSITQGRAVLACS